MSADGGPRLSPLNRACAICAAALAYIGASLIMLLAVTVGIQVFYRYLLNDPQAWTEQLAQFSFIWLTLLGCALATRHKENLAVTFLYNRFTGTGRLIMQILLDLAMIMVSFFWMWSSILQIRYTWDTIEAGINIRLGIVYLVFPVTFALIMLFAAEDVVDQIRSARIARGGN